MNAIRNNDNATLGLAAPERPTSDTAHVTSDWLESLKSLVERFPGYGIDDDLAALALADLWGLYRFLARLSQD